MIIIFRGTVIHIHKQHKQSAIFIPYNLDMVFSVSQLCTGVCSNHKADSVHLHFCSEEAFTHVRANVTNFLCAREQVLIVP